jgi:hypothetical protein
MPASGNVYAQAVGNVFAGKINYLSDTIKLALVSSSYTPNLTTDEYWSTPQADEITGTGYTAGGATLASKTATQTAANSWGQAWAASTAYAAGFVIRPSTGNGYLYQNATAGTSGSTAPTFPTVVGETVADGGCIWTCVGTAIVVFSAATVQWTASTISAAAAVLYDATPGTAATDPLIAVYQFGTTVSDTDGTFQVPPDPNLGYFYLILQ